MRKTYPTLAAYLADTNTTQAEFAALVGTTQQHVSRIVAGIVNPGFHLALKISAVARVPVESLANSAEARQ